MTRYYTGIGSRSAPKEVLEYFYLIGYFLANKGFTLRSGGAQGADSYFEAGCDRSEGSKEIYLPWKNFEGSSSDLIISNPQAYEIAERFHPYWYNLSEGAQKLQARNSHQVFGLDLKTPSEFLLCWTKRGLGEGGTGQAIRIASRYDIPVFDAGNWGTVDEIKANLKKFFIENNIFSEENLSKSE